MMLVVYGPTSTGKTSLAISLAKKLGGEILSVDSRQVFKGLDIGSGKVPFESKVEKHRGYWVVDGVRVWGFDLIEPGEKFSAALFIKYAKTQLEKIEKSGRLAIVVGGTGFYIKSLIYGLPTIGIGPNQKLREKLDGVDAKSLFAKLMEIDPVKAESLNESDRSNPRRLVRAIELCYAGRKITNLNALQMDSFKLIGLTASNEYLFKRSDQWIDKRLSKGLTGEVKSLLVEGVNYQWLEGLGLEYRWITKYLCEDVDFETAIQRLKGDTHNLIRKQKTWFSQFGDICLYDVEKLGQNRLIGEILLML